MFCKHFLKMRRAGDLIIINFFCGQFFLAKVSIWTYRVFNKLDDIFSRLLIQLGIFFLLYYGRVLDAKGCQFIVPYSIL